MVAKPKGTLYALGGAVVGFFAALAALASNISTIRHTAEWIFPSLAPFDASISLANARPIPNPTLTQKAFEGSTPEPAVQFSIEYLESTTGHSKLEPCHTELALAGSTYKAAPERPTKPNVQEMEREVFVVRQNEYAGEASVRQMISAASTLSMGSKP
ncbi:MAG: hypothetical protein AB7F22_30570 [Reyranella sp.]|uniref:hypothetical protein n=1 Tax=Reyranella sp. TaxID=1929291 RepID=UPI003D0F927B